MSISAVSAEHSSKNSSADNSEFKRGNGAHKTRHKLALKPPNSDTDSSEVKKRKFLHRLYKSQDFLWWKSAAATRYLYARKAVECHPRCLQRLRAHAWLAVQSLLWADRLWTEVFSVLGEGWSHSSYIQRGAWTAKTQQGCPKHANKIRKATSETPYCQRVCCCKYLLQLNEQRQCLHSNTHLEDEWICTVQKGDSITGEKGSDFKN